MNGSANQAELQLTERALPELAGDDVLVANRAVALNPVDGKVLDSATVGSMALGRHTGHIPGVGGAGVVVADGSEAKVRGRARDVSPGFYSGRQPRHMNYRRLWMGRGQAARAAS